MEKNYVAKVLLALKGDNAFFSTKQKNFLIGLSENDIKKIKKHCLENNLIKQKEKTFVLTQEGFNLIEDFEDKFKITNLEYLKVEKTPPILTKAIRALARHLLEQEELKKDSLEQNLKKELLNFKDLKKEVENYFSKEKETNLETFFDKFLSLGLTKSIVSILLLNFLSKNKENFAFYERNQFQLNFDCLMFDRIIANPKNFTIKKTVLESSFLNEKINILSQTKDLILKFKKLEKLTLQTTNLSPKTLKFKNIVLNSKDPIQLFEHDLKNIFKDKKEFENAYLELQNFYAKTIKELNSFTLKTFKTDSFEDLKARFEKIKEFINDKDFLILGNNLTSIKRFATFINQKRVPKDWNDLDIANFKLKVKEFSNQFLILESTLESSDLTPEKTTQNLIDKVLKLDKIQKNILLRSVV